MFRRLCRLLDVVIYDLLKREGITLSLSVLTKQEIDWVYFCVFVFVREELVVLRS